MGKGFFSYFPTIRYNGAIVTNILAKVRFDQSVSKSLASFYPYTLKEGERADHVAKWYYGDAYFDWVVYFSNNITDPYHGWPLTEQQLNDLCTAKYGSVAQSQALILFYRNNFYGDDTILTVPAYDALAAVSKRYFAPIPGMDGNIVGYERKRASIVVESVSSALTYLAPAERVYYSGVSAYEHESDLNEAKKQIRLLQPAYIPQIEKDMKELLSA